MANTTKRRDALSVRFRRFDVRNFVIERRVPGTEEWTVVGFYGSLPAMLADSVGTSAWGDSALELAESLQASTRELIAAFHEAVENGLLNSERAA